MCEQNREMGGEVGRGRSKHPLEEASKYVCSIITGHDFIEEFD